MEDRDKAGFENLLLALGATFRVEVTAPMRVGYWLGLRDLPMADLQAAVAKALTGSRFMPTPRELRDMAGVMSAEQRAIVAWGAVKRAIRTVGSYRSVNFDDPTVNAAMHSLGGWPRVCGTESEDLDKWTAKEFQRLYCAMASLQLGPDVTRHLPGIFEMGGDQTLTEPPAQVATGTARPAGALEGGGDGGGAQVIMLPGKAG